MTTVKAEVSGKLMSSLKRVIRKHLAPSKVVDVHVKGKAGWEDEPILTIYVVIRKQAERLGLPDPEGYLALRNHVYSTLEQAGDARRPLFRFLSEEDMSNVRI